MQITHFGNTIQTNHMKGTGSINGSDNFGVGKTFFLPMQTSGVTLRPSSLTINGVSRTPTHLWDCRDATLSGLVDSAGDADLFISGSGNGYLVNEDTPFLDASKAIRFKSGKILAAQTTEAVTFGTDDLFVSMIIQCPNGSSGTASNFWCKGNTSASNAQGISLSMDDSQRIVFRIANASGVSQSGTLTVHPTTTAAAASVQGKTYVHVCIGLNRAATVLANRMKCSANGVISSLSSSGGALNSTDSLDDGVSVFKLGCALMDQSIVYCEMYKAPAMWNDATFSTQFQAAVLEMEQRLLGFRPAVALGSSEWVSAPKRSGSNTVVQKGGKYVMVSANWPRLIEDSAGIRGYLSEQVNNQAFDDNYTMVTSWTFTNATASLSSSVNSPIYTVPAIELADTAVSGNHAASKTVVASTINILSIMVKPGSKNWIKVGATTGGTNVFAYFDVSNGSVGTVGSGVLGTFVEQLNDGWYRVGIRASVSSSTACQFLIADGNGVDTYTGTGAVALYVCCPMMETGTSSLRHPTSPCLTSTTSSGSRGPDSGLIYSATNNVNGSASSVDATLQADVKMYNADVLDTGAVLYVGDGTTANRIQIVETSSDQPQFAVTASSIDQATITGVDDLSDGTVHAIKFSCKTNSFKAYLDGSLVGTDTLGTSPAVSQIRVGGNSTSTAATEGIVKNVKMLKKAV